MLLGLPSRGGRILQNPLELRCFSRFFAPSCLHGTRGNVGNKLVRGRRVSPARDGQLVSQGDEFELQGEATTNPEREQGTEGGKKRERANDGMVVAPKAPCFLGSIQP